MNLYELQKEINEKRLYQKLLMDKIKLLRCKTEPGAVQMKEVVSKPTNTDKTKIIDKIIECEKEFELLQEEIDVYKPIIDELEVLFKEFKDRDKLIYTWVKLQGYSDVKAGMMLPRYGWNQLTDRQVRNIIKKIDESFENFQKFPMLSGTMSIIGQ